jgi:transcriptional regulator with XRE-family HTH domain
MQDGDTVGRRAAIARRAAGLTQEQAIRELVARLGDGAPTVSWLSKVEADVIHDPGARMLGELARLYGCELDELVFGKGAA